MYSVIRQPRWYPLWPRYFRVAQLSSGTEKAPFGFQDVTANEKARLVHKVFERVAKKYDLMNDIMTAGIHRQWKDHFVSYLQTRPGMRILDVAGGTGDIAFRILDRAIRRGHQADFSVKLLDINEHMLAIGQARARDEGFLENENGLEWIVGDAERLPIPDASVDAYTIAFGIRNCTRIERVLSEAYRVLRPNGQFLCLELSPDAFKGAPSLIRRLHEGYSFEIIPVLGQLFAADSQSYLYLVESIRRFPDQLAFDHMIKAAGFGRVAHEGLFYDVAAIHSAWKQPPPANTGGEIRNH